MPDDAARAAKLTRVQVAVALRRGPLLPGPIPRWHDGAPGHVKPARRLLE